MRRAFQYLRIWRGGQFAGFCRPDHMTLYSSVVYAYVRAVCPSKQNISIFLLIFCLELFLG